MALIATAHQNKEAPAFSPLDVPKTKVFIPVRAVSIVR
jgi:hypothetical protein